MDNYQIAILIVIGVIVLGAIIVAARSDKETRGQIFGFASTILLSLLALLQINNAIKTHDTGVKVEAVTVKQDEIAEKADKAAVKVEEIAVTTAETKVSTDDKLLEIKKAAEDTREMVQTKLNP